MPRPIFTGTSDFVKIRETGSFYVDKSAFIRDWWEGNDQCGASEVTLITRPRRFGKTLMQNTVKAFFSPRYENRADLFKGLDIWRYKKYRALQGTIPVIFLSFAGNKYDRIETTIRDFNNILVDVRTEFFFLRESAQISIADQDMFSEISPSMDPSTATRMIPRLCRMLFDYYDKKTILLIDEYDTPLQSAWMHGFWDDVVEFMRSLFTNALKDNEYLERALLTGATRVAKESLFSGVNNIDVFSIMTSRYETAFGFTQEEVLSAMDEYGLTDRVHVQAWYDGFTFGREKGIYNPWSITQYLKTKKLGIYWAATSDNALVGKLVREGKVSLKTEMESLLTGEGIRSPIDEQVVFSRLTGDSSAVWSLLLAAGYLKVIGTDESSSLSAEDTFPLSYTLKLTNGEVVLMMRQLIADWFRDVQEEYGWFEKSLLSGDVRMLNRSMNEMTAQICSFFDTARDGRCKQPERFYHGFVLGMLVKMRDRYVITSNRESGYGRYDVLLEPHDRMIYPAVIIEFKSIDPYTNEKTLEDTADAALRQIEEKNYAANLLAKGFDASNIRTYGFAFEGKNVLIKAQPCVHARSE